TELDIPVTEIVPEKVVEELDSLVKLICFKRIVDGFSCFVQTRDYPSIGQRRLDITGRNANVNERAAWFTRGTLPNGRVSARNVRARYTCSVRVHQTKPCRVPDLVREVSERFDTFVTPCEIDTGRRARKGHSRRINAVFVENLKRVYAVALRLRHSLTV